MAVGQRKVKQNVALCAVLLLDNVCHIAPRVQALVRNNLFFQGIQCQSGSRSLFVLYTTMSFWCFDGTKQSVNRVWLFSKNTSWLISLKYFVGFGITRPWGAVIQRPAVTENAIGTSWNKWSSKMKYRINNCFFVFKCILKYLIKRATL